MISQQDEAAHLEADQAAATDGTSTSIVLNSDCSTNGREGQSGRNYLDLANYYADKVILWLQSDGTEADLIDADVRSWMEHCVVLDDRERVQAVNHAKSRIDGDLPKEIRPVADHLFFDEVRPENHYDDVAELAESFGILPRGATWADMDERIGPISWAWSGWLPNGFLTLVVGEQGEGKSYLCLKVVASFLRGDAWPDGTPFTGNMGAVVWCEAEASQALNLERARDWNLPLNRVYTPLDDVFADIQLHLSEHQEAVTELAHRPEVQLVVVDSLRGAHPFDENSSISMEVVKWLAELARNAGKPVLLTHHLRKRGLFDAGDGISLDRVRGSSAITQTCRVVWAIDKPDVESDARRLSVIKNNLTRFADPIGLTIGDDGLVFGDAPEAPKTETKLDQGIDLLKALLSDGPMWSSDLKEEAEGAGLSWDTMKRAKDRLGVVVKRDGRLKKWAWSLPARGHEE